MQKHKNDPGSVFNVVACLLSAISNLITLQIFGWVFTIFHAENSISKSASAIWITFIAGLTVYYVVALKNVWDRTTSQPPGEIHIIKGYSLMFYFCPVDYEYFFLSFSRRRWPSLKRQIGLEGQLSVLVSTLPSFFTIQSRQSWKSWTCSCFSQHSKNSFQKMIGSII